MRFWYDLELRSWSQPSQISTRSWVFLFWEQEKFTGGQVTEIRWLKDDFRDCLDEKITNKQRCVSRTIILKLLKKLHGYKSTDMTSVVDVQDTNLIYINYFSSKYTRKMPQSIFQVLYIMEMLNLQPSLTKCKTTAS